jgi:transposase InsO family protein
MVVQNDTDRPRDRWAHLRFSIVGPLLASPPGPGELQDALRQLATKFWKHPDTGMPVRFGVSSIERWYYLMRSHPQDPVASLRRRHRQDVGLFPCLAVEVRQALLAQYKAHTNWSYQLHYDNLVALACTDTTVSELPSYATVRRYLRAQGMVRRPMPRDTAGGREAAARLESREVRGYDCPQVHGLWHLDFHHGSLKVLTTAGKWEVPVVLAVIDDCSRLICHVQWYLHETAQTLVHGLSQAMQKRGLPRGLMSDNGSAMIAAETTRGLKDLGITHETTLPYSPYQNGKQEVFWATLEGRLMRMLDGERELSLTLLNEATQAWVDGEYNRRLHSELGKSPLERLMQGPSVGRDGPGNERLRQVFRQEVARTQRRGDGTISLSGRRYEIPSRYRHLVRILVRFARWDLAFLHLVDGRTGQDLCRLYPQDKEANATGERKKLQRIAGSDPWVSATEIPQQEGRAPLLAKLMADYAATGFPPAYVPLNENDDAIESATAPASNTEDES